MNHKVRNQSILITLLFVHAVSVSADDLSVLRLSLEQRSQLLNYLENNLCTCGCGMTIGQCLREDPTCPVSPKMARTAIEQLRAGNRKDEQLHRHSQQQGGDSRPQIYNYDGGGGYVGGDKCSYVSYGGMSFKTCDE